MYIYIYMYVHVYVYIYVYIYIYTYAFCVLYVLFRRPRTSRREGYLFQIQNMCPYKNNCITYVLYGILIYEVQILTSWTGRRRESERAGHGTLCTKMFKYTTIDTDTIQRYTDTISKYTTKCRTKREGERGREKGRGREMENRIYIYIYIYKERERNK